MQISLAYNKSHGCTKNALARRALVPLPDPIRGARWIPLTAGKFAIVDAADYDRVKNINWRAQKSSSTWYACHNKWVDGKMTITYLHRFVMSAEDGNEVDHRDGNGLNCRKGNLRECTHAKNQMNYTGWRKKTSSKFKGVQPSRWKWRASIKVAGKTRSLGTFATEEDAARAYNAAATNLFGEFAKLNVIP